MPVFFSNDIILEALIKSKYIFIHIRSIFLPKNFKIVDFDEKLQPRKMLVYIFDGKNVAVLNGSENGTRVIQRNFGYS